MVPNRGGHRVVPNVSNDSSSSINRLANSFQVNGSGVKKAPPIPPNKPSVSIYKPLSKLEGMVNSPSDARSGAIDLAKWNPHQSFYTVDSSKACQDPKICTRKFTHQVYYPKKDTTTEYVLNYYIRIQLKKV